jgi:ferredoxin
VVLNKPFIVPELCIGCGICEAECPVQDQPAVYVTAVGESRSKQRRLLLKSRDQTKT